MASLKSIRTRIGSIKNTQKITRAMKMVAAARLRRAQQRIVGARPHALKTLEVLSSVAARAGDEEVHPLLARRPAERVMLVVLTSDKGLAGAFNSNINRRAFAYQKELEDQGKHVTLVVAGRKGREYFRRRNKTITKEFIGALHEVTMESAAEIGSVVVHQYTHAELDAVYVVYNEFKSAITQQVVIEPLLPITPMDMSAEQCQSDFIYEPSKRALLDRLLPLYVDIQIYRALLESAASEHGARMTAMEAATTNAKDLIGSLTLQFNRARQAAITTELMEIIGGAEALKG